MNRRSNDSQNFSLKLSTLIIKERKSRNLNKNEKSLITSIIIIVTTKIRKTH